MNASTLSCEKLTRVSKEQPCIHCGKEDWCYRLGELSVCNRDAEPAKGWMKTSKSDNNDKPFYAPEQPKKNIRPKSRNEYVYTNVDGVPQIKVTVIRNGQDSSKRVFQEYWVDGSWTPAKGVSLEQKRLCQSSVNWYRIVEIRKALKEDASRPVFIVEGEGVADSLWELGLLATTSIGGAGKFLKYGNNIYNSELGGTPYQVALEDAIEIVLCPDRDEPGLKHMQEINRSFPQARWLLSPPSDFYWSHLPPSGGADVKDWIESGATVEDILSAVRLRSDVVESFESSLSKDAEREAPAKSELKQNYNLIKSQWGNRLAWNTLKKQVELDGQKLPLDRIKLKIAKEFDIHVSKEDAAEIIVDLAMDNSYSPVVKYLDSLSYKGKQSPEEFLNGLAPSYFGTSNFLHAALFKHTLIAGVARAYEPGCKVDTICILQGQQGVLKSTFWKILAGIDFFTDDISSGSEKDEVMKISQYWVLEYAEFETAYKKKEVSHLKAFLSRPFDSIRMPYGRDIQDFYRPSIFVGTTNKTEFLHDPTGERRYWVIPVSKKIDIAKLQKQRDQIWAAAVECYRSGVLCYLNDQEEEALKSASEVFQSSDSWQQPIEEYLLGRTWTTPKNVLTECLGFELSRIEKRDEMRVTQILRLLQWDKSPNQKRIDGQKLRVWEPINLLQVETGLRQDLNSYAATNTEIFDDASSLEAEARLRRGVEAGSSPYTTNTSELVSQPSHCFSENFSDGNENGHYHLPLKQPEVLEKKVETAETPAERIASQATQGVSAPCLNPLSQPMEFDVGANAQLMVECLQKENAGQLLSKLMSCWTKKHHLFGGFM